jgi:acyl carrier protein
MNAHAKLPATEDQIVAWCVDYLAKTLNTSAADITPDKDIDQFGLDSAIVTSMVMDLETWLGIEVPLALLFEHRTLNDLAAALAGQIKTAAPAHQV